MKLDDLSGRKFGFWTVLEVCKKRDKYGQVLWKCRCKCGAEKDVVASAMRNGTSTKCSSCASKKHGLDGSPVYGSWTAMMQRCTNPNNVSYHDYGGRGIVVCDEWKDFQKFFADMGDRPEGMTLDRIDSSKGYCKENCRWATAKEQMRNRRDTKKYEYDGESQALGYFADKIGIPVRRVQQRLHAGWDLQKALTTPIGPTGRKEKTI